MSNMCSFSLSSEARNDAEIVGPQDVLEMGATIAPGSGSAGRTRSRRPKNFFEGLACDARIRGATVDAVSRGLRAGATEHVRAATGDGDDHQVVPRMS